jgi:hypothetical protein
MGRLCQNGPEIGRLAEPCVLQPGNDREDGRHDRLQKEPETHRAGEAACKIFQDAGLHVGHIKRLRRHSSPRLGQL